jgi:Right handed beta helix region
MIVPIAMIVLLIVVGVLLLLSRGSSDNTTVSCDVVAGPAGARAMIGALRPGETGCLRAGEYRFDELKLTRPEIELASAPGEWATLRGRLWIAAGADGITIRDLGLDGVNGAALPSPTVNADRTTFADVDVTNHHTGICFDIGNAVFGRATGTVIEDSRVHDCGQVPSTNMQHGIYLSDAGDTTIEGNWIYDNADRGIQLYPDVQGTRIVDNVIYGNGEGIIFSGNEEVAAGDTLVEGNVIADSRIRRNVESFYPPGGPVGEDNVVTRNCVFGAAAPYYDGPEDSGVESDPRGFTFADNVVGRPEFVDPAAGDFRLRHGSPCGKAAAATAGVPAAGANS